MEFIKTYLKNPITTAVEKGKEGSTKFGLIGLAIYFAYLFLSNIVNAWKAATYSFYGDPTFGEKIESYFEYLFENDGLVTCLKTSLITVALVALFILAIFIVLKVMKKSDISYIRILTTMLVANIYIVPINLVLGLLGIFDVEILVNITGVLSIIYMISLLILNVYTIHSLLEEENYDKSLLYTIVSIASFVIVIALVLFVFSEDIAIPGLNSISKLL